MLPSSIGEGERYNRMTAGTPLQARRQLGAVQYAIHRAMAVCHLVRGKDLLDPGDTPRVTNSCDVGLGLLKFGSAVARAEIPGLRQEPSTRCRKRWSQSCQASLSWRTSGSSLTSISSKVL